LLDDESEVVKESLLKLFKKNPDNAQLFLCKVSKHNSLAAKHAKSIQEQLGWTDGREIFLQFIQSQRYELESGWFLLDKTVFPTMDASVVSLTLDSLADRARELMVPPMEIKNQCAIINRVLFHENSFRGAGKNFENPNNSFLHKVLETKTGLPITLSLIYILVARRLGLELEPIGLPGRFMVGCFSERVPFYIDVWAGGRFIELDEMSSYLGLSIDECSGSVLLPVTIGETLARACRNLAHHYALGGRKKEAEMFKDFVVEFEKTLKIEPHAP
jgi:regulator of sirC expression with transglutaminase-like and TPR domain